MYIQDFFCHFLSGSGFVNIVLEILFFQSTFISKQHFQLHKDLHIDNYYYYKG